MQISAKIDNHSHLQFLRDIRERNSVKLFLFHGSIFYRVFFARNFRKENSAERNSFGVVIRDLKKIKVC
jgi:hypothetical protein